MSYLSWIILALALIAVVVILIGWWYERATNEVSLVKTGLGGARGPRRWHHSHPLLQYGQSREYADPAHSRRALGGQSLITLDKLRIDVGQNSIYPLYQNAMPLPGRCRRLGIGPSIPISSAA